MEIPLDATVLTSDGTEGRTVCLIINPATNDVTHFVVRLKEMAGAEYIVPIDAIVASGSEKINLSLTRPEIIQCEPFTRAKFYDLDQLEYWPSADPTLYGGGPGDTLYWPYATAESGQFGVYGMEERIPAGELGLFRGASVEASDGHVGHVEEFIIDSETHHITHIILREGHFWGKKDVTIPLSAVDHYDSDAVYLKLDKAAVHQLEAVPVRRGKKK